MARTNIPLSDFVPNASLADPAGTAADAANGHVINPDADWPNATLEEIVLRVVNGGGGSTEVTVLAGANPPALQAGEGNLVESVAAGATEFIGPFTSARFRQVADDAAGDAGGLWVDLDVDTSVTLTAFRTPRSA